LSYKSSRHPDKTITDIDYADDIALLSNTIDEATKLLHSVENAVREIVLLINVTKTEIISCNQIGEINSLDGDQMQCGSEFVYLDSDIQPTERDIQIRKGKA
jgi:hypothetical protein